MVIGNKDEAEQADIALILNPPVEARNLDLNIALSKQAMFWRPRHVVASPMLGQLPFLFWIMETAQPRSIAQIGLGDGLVYMALCQSIEHLGGRTSCVGFDTSTPILSESLLHQHNAYYSDFSVLLTQDFATNGGEVANELDMLVLNSSLSEERLQTLLTGWLPKLSNQALILICQPAQSRGLSALSKVGKDERPTIAGPISPAGGRLDVILHGFEQPERLLRLVARTSDKAHYLAAKRVFGRLGQGIEDALRVRELQSGRQEADKELAVRQAEWQAKFVTLEQSLAEARRQIEAFQTARETNRARDARAEVSFTAALAQVEALREEKAALAAETAELREQLVASNAARATEQTKVKTLQKEKTALAGQSVKLRNELAAAERKLNAVHRSTSWRITRPLRSVKLASMWKKKR